MATPFFVVVVFFLFTLCLWALPAAASTMVGCYSDSCPKAESIVRAAIRSHVQSDWLVAPGLLRMHFHDCFVRGCDGSILVNGTSSERTAFPNLSLRWFEIIDDVKARLERACPGVVSCADILALAARDSVVLLGGPSWEVPTGRRDGRVSSASDFDNFPSPRNSIDVLKHKFAWFGLNTKDLVTLLGAHTIGEVECQFFSYRLYNYTSNNGPDPSINSWFLQHLRRLCPPGGDGEREVALDAVSPRKFDNFYHNLERGMGMLESDQKLWTDPSTKKYVESYTGLINSLLGAFEYEFPKSMVKMSNIGVLTGHAGEIRRVCSAFNDD